MSNQPTTLPRPGQLRHDRLFLVILLAGVLVRIAFLLVGAKVYYGSGNEYFNGDTTSYVMSFRNLVERGTYTFDFLEPDAAVGRLPGYSFFYGIHYLIFGAEKALPALACTQVLLDCLAIGLVFLIARKLTPGQRHPTPYIAAALYAFYPFIIVWTTVAGTELLATFLVLLWLNTLLSPKTSKLHYALLGLEVALMFYVRDFLGIFLPITCLYLLLGHQTTRKLALRNCTIICLAFGSLYIWWPVRNYVFQHRLMLVKPKRAGYANYKADMEGFLGWVHSWTNESTYWLQQVLNNPSPAFPADIFASPQEQEQAQNLVKKAMDCGSSFYIYKHMDSLDYGNEQAMRANKDYNVQCNDEISQGFTALQQSFKARNPVTYYTRVPLQNLHKVFFKSGTQDDSGNTKKQLLLSVIFGYRTLLLALGVIGLLVFWRVPGLRPIAAYWGFIVLFICWYFRQLEMRYLIQADVLMLLPAAMLLGKWLAPWVSKRPLPGADAPQ